MQKWLTTLRARLPYLVLWGIPGPFILALLIFSGEARTLVMRWLFFVGFIFNFWVGAWAVITITRMQHDQAVAVTVLQALAATAGLRDAIVKLHGKEQE